jgi:acetyl-CoA acetyltransferase
MTSVPDPYISAVGLSPIGSTDLTGRDLFTTALTETFEGLPPPADVVDAVYVGNQSELYEHQIMYGTIVAEWCGLRFTPAERVEGCAAAGALALRHAVRDVRTGTHDAVLACGIEKMTAGGSELATESLSAAFDRPLEQRAGVTAPSQYALLAQRYLHDTDATEEDLAKVAVKNHENASRNPRAQFQSEIDVETVLESDYVARPLKLFDCAPVSDGAAAVLVTNEEVASTLGSSDEQVQVSGVGAASNNISVAERDLTFIEGANVAANRAYNQADLSPEDIDVAEVHDAFTVCEPLLAEAVGFAPRGSGFESALHPSERSTGWTDVRLSTSGGLKARGHPIGATGLAQAVEVYEQLTETATPERQVPDARTGLLVNEGGVADAVTVAHVLTT